MGIHGFHVKNRDISLHGLSNDGDMSVEHPPVVFIPGLWGQAEQFAEILTSIEPRRAFALSLRGRGQSSVPETGYSLEDQASDIESFANEMELDKFFLVTVSAGASYAISYASRNSEKLAGLFITDYPPISKSYPPQMVEGVLADIKNIKISRQFLEGLQRESRAMDLSYLLKQIRCPVTVFRGGKSGAYLNEEYLDAYRKNLTSLSVKTLIDVAHDPLEAPACLIQGLTSQI